MQQTIRNQRELEERCNLMLDYTTFMQNFFFTCSEYDLQTNYTNYRLDLELMKKTENLTLDFEEKLIDAFFSIASPNLNIH